MPSLPSSTDPDIFRVAPLLTAKLMVLEIVPEVLTKFWAMVPAILMVPEPPPDSVTVPPLWV